jgi:thiol:disulfide interchange protein DsbC
MKLSLTALLLSALAAASLSTGALAGQDAIRKAIEQSFPGTRINSIAASPIHGLHEVVTDGPEGLLIVYADDKGEHLLVGDLINMQTRRNLTRDRTDKLTLVSWSSLPLDDAIKSVKGDGSRQFAVFSDPDCPYCRKAEAEFAKLDNVTVYTFAYPLPMHPDAERKAKLVWCSEDRAKAWHDLMLKGVVPKGRTDCDNPLEANLALGEKIRIQGTPAMIFPNGKRVPGYVEAGRLELMLNEIADARIGAGN